ncbi:hypothetical protein RB595_005982 [Gaeumannomyces hyphopodioides]
MQPPRSLALLGLGLLAPSGALAAVDGLCPIMGAVLPAPTEPASHAAVQKALADFKTTVGKIVGSLNRTAVSVAVKSIHECSPLFELHHTPPTLDPRGVQKVDANSVYRLGSISKIFPVLALLKLDGVSLDDKVTKYLPELRALGDQATVEDAVSQVEWDEVTLGALASHLSGIAADYAIDFANFPGFNTTQRGLPPKKNITDPGCAGIAGTRPCTEQDFFKGFGNRAPVFAPFSAPAYSNIGSPLLSFVVERLTNKSYAEFFQAAVLQPLGLNDTGIKKPADSRGVIPLNDTWWSTDIGFEAAAGGFYSTLNNMLKFGDAVLSNKILSPAATRKWLKPMTNTASLGTQLGAPWEIFRATNVTRDQRAIEIITKGGDLFNYRSTLAMVPDYGLVFTVLLGGDSAEKGMSTAVPLIQAAAVRMLLPALEQAGKDQARTAHAGTYRDEATNSTAVLEVSDADAGPGIRVARLVVRGVDVIATYPAMRNLGASPPAVETLPPTRLRLYPATGLATARRQAWRGVYSVGAPEKVAEDDAPFPWLQNRCVTWASTDRDVYGLQALDRFVFNSGKEGGAGTGVTESLEMPAYQVKMVRVVEGN